MPIKNKIYNVNIDTVNHLGYGICRIDGMVCFVKGGVTGDELEVKVIKANKNYCIGRVEKIITPSKHRNEQNCPVYKRCGGCCFRHITYEHELELKKSFVEAEFKKAKLDIKVNDVVSAGETARYRNKAQYPVNAENKIGFYAEKTHEVCENSDCTLQPEVFGKITNTVKQHLDKYGIKGYNEETGKGLLRHIYIRQGRVTGDIQVCLVVNGNTLPHSDALVEELKKINGVVSICLNVNTKNTNVILGEKYVTLYGKEYIEDELCGFSFRISPASFYQVNHDCAELLYDKVYKLVTKAKCDRVTDLYCGTGTIGLCVAGRLKKCKLTGVEIVPEAIENAKINAKINNIENAEFICADSTDTQNNVLKESDVVILDPPRKGITEELANKIAESGVENIVYVSCSPDTLARDIKWFKELGYTCEEVTPFDMFPRTGHVESVVRLTRHN
ncbi:MAG: 23S rRNA (uracil(1939)-C(5))-methyltransferase RlmD [Clostridia bacterium]|nr:23S rRNA (uracil(1939)-C(5))-methyltransferase RlmD [Clostridia bacterium]